MPLLQLALIGGVHFRRGGSANAHPALASRGPNPDHYPHTAVLALSEPAMAIGTAEATIGPVRSGISWGAVFGGAAVATAVTIMLLALGSGLGSASVSPIGGGNPSAVTFTALAAVWLIIVQWVSSFFGGYLAGRLRPGWAGVRRDEVMFRDTASGFVAWAGASIFVVAVVASGTSSLLGGAGRAAASAASSAAGGLAQSAGTAPRDPSGYLLDALFRPSQPNSQENSTDAKAEAGRILAVSVTSGVSKADHDYLAQLVATRTGLFPGDAGTRVDQLITKEKQAADRAKQAANAARKAASSFAIYTFFSMLIGAFIACVAAAIGGRQRDAL